ncbi:hypothetical protein [Algibacter pectinivorans]|uniref:Uncharacterized protein n=1 Tax=Algibacter pectinivorans TaxID=870482 RepID=A0A1I1MHU5_9FLAO|nr:hypothetical protein [Algibacter pectinivorans]SFC81120.1 hypothetical protein SAMN04487987_10169 [Algibacter pectinivorans]
MNIFKTALCILTLSLTYTINAQDTTATSNTKIDKESYYQKRAAEDAKFEQQFKAENEEESEEFWQEQKAYEKELKKKDRQAYKAYMKGKRDAYAEHYEHCDNHCHHNTHYYSHASFYYYRYDGYYYNRQPQRRSTINTRVSLGAPRVRVGLGI